MSASEDTADILNRFFSGDKSEWSLTESTHRDCGGRLRLVPGMNPSETSRLAELALAQLWAQRSKGSALLASLLVTADFDARANCIPRNEREWTVANCIAATIMQWLGTAVGRAFIADAFQNAGGAADFTLPSAPTRRLA